MAAAPTPQRVLVAGASGFIGTELCRQLRADGHEVIRLVRAEPTAPDEHRWNPATGAIDLGLVASVDAIINLAGASIARIPWTRAYKHELLQSRLDATNTIVAAMNAVATPPKTLLNASAVGLYGDRPGEDLTEESPRGHGFVLADIVEAWEAAAMKAPASTRVVLFRTGLVVGKGGAFSPLGLLTRFGLASRIGSGQQYWPWIALTDEAAAIRHLLTSTLSGPVNLEGPEPATAERATRALAKAMKRWHPWVLPEFVIKLGMGEAGKELLLPSTKIVPTKLMDDGFVHEHRTVESAIDAIWRED